MPAFCVRIGAAVRGSSGLHLEVGSRRVTARVLGYFRPCTQVQGRGGHVHEDMAPVICCMRRDNWTNPHHVNHVSEPHPPQPQAFLSGCILSVTFQVKLQRSVLVERSGAAMRRRRAAAATTHHHNHDRKGKTKVVECQGSEEVEHEKNDALRRQSPPSPG